MTPSAPTVEDIRHEDAAIIAIKSSITFLLRDLGNIWTEEAKAHIHLIPNLKLIPKISWLFGHFLFKLVNLLLQLIVVLVAEL